jgi:hypothetical protein
VFELSGVPGLSTSVQPRIDSFGEVMGAGTPL